MNLFKKKIKCMRCGKNFNFKNDNGISIYVCSGYKNYGAKFCPRNIVHEEDLIKLVKFHMKLTDKNHILLEEYIHKYVQKIEVNGDSIHIFYEDEISEWNKNNLLI